MQTLSEIQNLDNSNADNNMFLKKIKILRGNCLIFQVNTVQVCWICFLSPFSHIVQPLGDTSGNAIYRVEYGYRPECNPQFHSVELPTFLWRQFINNVLSQDVFPISNELHNNTRSVTLLQRVKQNHYKEKKTAIRKKKTR
jgi:hypothetical protein